MPTRRTTPSTSHVVLSPTNTLKRALSEDADSDSPEPKKIKLKSESTPQSKDKKKRRKKKKKTPVVIPAELAVAHAASASASSHALDGSSPTLDPAESSMIMAQGKRKATSTPPAPPLMDQVKSGVEKKPLQTSDAAESPSDTIVRLTQELSAQSMLLKKHENALGQLNQSLTCQVCLDLLHKPFALAPCGHIACYNCLVMWFTSEPEEPHFMPRKKTCPHCRAAVKERPVEVWSIKDMVATLVRSGLVSGLSTASPPPPALPGPPQAAAATPDPWHNIFRYSHQHPRFHHHAPTPGEEPPSVVDMGMLDMEDGGVYRCLDCMHEIWDGVCTSCRRVYPGHRAPYDDDFEDGMFGEEGMFGDEDDSDGEGPPWPMEFDGFMSGMGPLPVPLPLPFQGEWWTGEGSDDSGGSIDEDDDGLGSFIDDDDDEAPRIIEIHDSDSEERESSPPRRRAPPSRRAPRILSSDDEAGSARQPRLLPRPPRRSPVTRTQAVVLSDDEGPRRPTRARAARHEGSGNAREARPLRRRRGMDGPFVRLPIYFYRLTVLNAGS
ncbi:hypothetical protein B0H15DRAFT_403374 [Mycena belliarum]|uniref:RING-type domain-containing protein n=1 Tax=Mycena belliarum TaxID=1033014 RepID=A0AAD6U2Z2_9AGAR|nr:hypothetical protein B0H15DRAFT_42191 [Mycena belliae]KAJ7084003.1 hypothetical protein B0H15DRAFT_403374 [Mycena belliae]